MQLLERLLSVMAPHRCLGCGDENTLLCAWCLPDAFAPLPSRCYGCQKTTTDNATCVNCRRHSPIKRLWATTGYKGLAHKLLHAYKFERASAGAEIIATAISDVLPFIPHDTIIVPVPTATSRVRQRGYDHAELIARHVAGNKGLTLIKAAARTTQSRQVGADRHLRKTQLRGAFIIVRPNLVKGANIIMIDDVVTTGGSLEALAAELKTAGAKTISAAVFAQKF